MSSFYHCKIDLLDYPTFLLGGHPFITSTGRGRGSGSGGRMWTGEGSSPMWAFTQTIKIRVH